MWYGLPKSTCKVTPQHFHRPQEGILKVAPTLISRHIHQKDPGSTPQLPERRTYLAAWEGLPSRAEQFVTRVMCIGCGPRSRVAPRVTPHSRHIHRAPYRGPKVNHGRVPHPKAYKQQEKANGPGLTGGSLIRGDGKPPPRQTAEEVR